MFFVSAWLFYGWMEFSSVIVLYHTDIVSWICIGLFVLVSSFARQFVRTD